MRIEVYGIRHHGPGSTRRLQKALRDQQPDCILLEAPQDAEAAFPYVANTGLIPPVAVLVYNPKDLQQAIYLPFARFSPEWQAIKYGLKKDIPVRAMDLPAGIQFRQQEELKLRLAPKEDAPVPDRLVRDPLGYMAQLAGYADSERWWEATFEETEDDTQVFAAVLEMMQALREETQSHESRENLLREAFMRKTLRKAIKDGFQNIAVICGAWHAPVLHDLARFPQKTDNATLRGLKKAKVNASWIPWSYERLARHSGYGAGVVSPAWYDLLFMRRSETAIRWMIKVARLFRKEDLDASSAHVMEAVRLAETLATMRGLRMAGIDELEEAAVSVLCRGEQAPLELIRERLVQGDVVGKVPDAIPSIPLQNDLQKSIKSARLTKEYVTSETVHKELDLRKPANLLASQLLHRLLLLGIPWGTPKQRKETETGRFAERWSLKWRPGYALRVIEAGMYGNTVAEATLAYTQHQLKKTKELSELTTLLDDVLKANLPMLVEELVQKVREQAAVTRDVLQLMAALPDLVGVWRYGSTYQTDEDALRTLIDELLPRIFAGLPATCVQMEEEPARGIFEHLLRLQGAISVLNDAGVFRDWWQTLHRVYENEQVHHLLRGLSARLLLNQGQVEVEEVAAAMSYALSTTEMVEDSARWLEGFLHGSGLLLVHQPELWGLVNEWVAQLPEDKLQEFLPVLRRTFSAFSATERQKMLQLVERGAPDAAGPGHAGRMLNKERVAIVLPTLRQMLGIEN